MPEGEVRLDAEAGRTYGLHMGIGTRGANSETAVFDNLHSVDESLRKDGRFDPDHVGEFSTQLVSDIVAAMQRGEMVTLYEKGPPGIGKTEIGRGFSIRMAEQGIATQAIMFDEELARATARFAAIDPHLADRRNWRLEHWREFSHGFFDTIAAEPEYFQDEHGRLVPKVRKVEAPSIGTNPNEDRAQTTFVRCIYESRRPDSRIGTLRTLYIAPHPLLLSRATDLRDDVPDLQPQDVPSILREVYHIDLHYPDTMTRSTAGSIVQETVQKMGTSKRIATYSEEILNEARRLYNMQQFKGYTVPKDVIDSLRSRGTDIEPGMLYVLYMQYLRDTEQFNPEDAEVVINLPIRGRIPWHIVEASQN